MTTSVKATISERTGRRVNSRNGREGDKIPTEGKRERHLNCCEGFCSVGNTEAIRVQRDRRGPMNWVEPGPNEHVESDAELYGGNCIQDTRDPYFLPRYRVSPVTKRVRGRI